MKIPRLVRTGTIGIAAAMLALSFANIPAISDDGLTKICRSHFRIWKKMANHKAFAASQMNNGMQGCGYSYAWKTRQKAIASALRECRTDARHYIGIDKPVCRLIKVD